MTSWTRRLAPSLDSREQNKDHIVCQVFEDGTRLYTSFPNKDDFVTYVLQSTRTANELLYGPCAFFADLDGKLPLEKLGFTIPEYVEMWSTFFVEQFQKHLGVTIQKHSIMWSHCCRPEKTSFHCVIPHTEFYWPGPGSIKQFGQILKQESFNVTGFYYLTEKDNQLVQNSCLDVSVYGKNRCFRVTACCKPENQLPLLPLKNGTEIPVSHTVVYERLITETDVKHKSPYVLKTKPEKKKTSNTLDRTLLSRLAAENGCEVSSIRGSLVILKNISERVCCIGNTVHLKNNAFFVKRNSCLFMGCHSEKCAMKLRKVHTFPSIYQTYEDYVRILETPQTERCLATIHDFFLSTTSFIDSPKAGSFVVRRTVPTCFAGIHTTETVCTPCLFRNKNDIKVKLNDDETVKFSQVLQDLQESRNLKTYTGTTWIPFNSKSKFQPTVPPEKLNLFNKFVLEQDIETEVDFEKTKIFELLKLLTNGEKDGKAFNFFLQFLGWKVQAPHRKLPLLSAFLDTPVGCGKGTFKLFLTKLLTCSQTCVLSYNKMQQFTSVFNEEQRFSLAIFLEELSANDKNSVKEYSGILKDITSMESTVYEAKWKDRVVGDFFANLFVFSNSLHCMTVERNCRRVVAYMVDKESDKINNREFFDQVHREINDVKVMKSAFDYFTEMNLDSFRFREYPKTRLLTLLKECSDTIDHKFVRHLFTNILGGEYEHEFSEQQLFEYFQMFAEETGVPCKRDICWLAANFRSVTGLRQTPEKYFKITRKQCDEILVKIFGQK